MGQLPVLEYTDCCDGSIGGTNRTLTQSVAIIEFLDHAFPNTKRLVPIDPMDRISAMEIIEIINSGTQPLQNHATIKLLEEVTKNEDAVNTFRHDSIVNGLQSINHKLKLKRQSDGKVGPYSMGTFSPTIADCFLIPQLYNARRYGVQIDGNDEFSLLRSVEDACNNHPWFIQSHPLHQPDTPSSEKKK
jgi:maleylacetoacetate isomerase